MKIYTRGGDTGETSLFGGERVRKNAPRVAAYGEVDELNSALGVARAELGDADLCAKLETIQSSLFDLGGELATPAIADRAARGKAGPRVAERDVLELETWIDQLETELEPLRNFILPGGARAAALLHLGRTVCRRAERAVISLGEREPIEPLLVRYLNRLSDFLFVLARVVNRRAGVAEPQWIGRER
jgi:cob(I)alamin adenosyltransferase